MFMKKALAVILSVVMVICASTALTASAVEMPDLQKTTERIKEDYPGFVSSLVIPTLLEADVTLDKESYYYGDDINVELTIFNGTGQKLDTFFVRNKLTHTSQTSIDRAALRQTVMEAGETITRPMTVSRVPSMATSSAIYQIENLTEEMVFIIYKQLSMLPGSRIVCASDLVFFMYGSIPTYMHTYVFAFVSGNEAVVTSSDAG